MPRLFGFLRSTAPWAKHGVVWLGVALAALVWVAQNFAAPGWLTQLEERSGDLAWRLAAQRTDERRIIIVDIDDRSLQELGPWPWPRATQAQLVQQIAASGAGQQIYDVIFADPRPGDELLAQALQSQQAVLAQVFALEQGGAPSMGKLAAALDWPACAAPFSVANGYIANTPAVAANTLHIGHITPRVGLDGFVRHLPAVICFAGQAYPALGLSAVLSGTGQRALALQPGSNAAWQLSSPAFPSGSVPLDSRGDLRVSWHLHPDSFISLSAADVLAGRVPAGLLKNAWVLVGSSAFGLNDAIATPFAGTTSGMQVHAQVIAALLDDRTPYTPRAAPAYQVLAAVMGLILLLALRSQRLSVYLLPVAAVAWGSLLWVVHAVFLTQYALWLGWASPALYIVVAGLALGILEHARSRLDRDRLYQHLSSYLPAPVAAALALQPPSGAIKASNQLTSVLFADIRNFSAYLDARPPEEAAAVLHAFFSVATRVVQAHGGVIEAFQGDAVVAVWNGDPSANQPNIQRHAQSALTAAIDLLHAMQGVLPDPAPAGLEPLALGIGVETGPAMVGSFGLASRRTHMVMGRTVTIASRLVDMTAELAHPILVGEGLAAQVGAAGLESMGIFLLDGMRFPHHIYAHPLAAPSHPE